MRDQPFDWRPYIIEFHRQAPKLMRARAFVLGGVLQLRLVGSEGTVERALRPNQYVRVQGVDVAMACVLHKMIAREDRPIVFAGLDLAYNNPVVVAVPAAQPQPPRGLSDLGPTFRRMRDELRELFTPPKSVAEKRQKLVAAGIRAPGPVLSMDGILDEEYDRLRGIGIEALARGK